MKCFLLFVSCCLYITSHALMGTWIKVCLCVYVRACFFFYYIMYECVPRWPSLGQSCPAFLGCTRAMVGLTVTNAFSVVLLRVCLPPSLSPSLQPFAYTDTHKMLLGAGWTAVCLVTLSALKNAGVEQGGHNLKTAVVICLVWYKQFKCPHVSHKHTRILYLVAVEHLG